MRPRQWWAESAPPGWNSVKVSENLDATVVAPVAPVDTSLNCNAPLLRRRRAHYAKTTKQNSEMSTSKETTSIIWP